MNRHVRKINLVITEYSYNFINGIEDFNNDMLPIHRCNQFHENIKHSKAEYREMLKEI